jgi:hypothetical protein
MIADDTPVTLSNGALDLGSGGPFVLINVSLANYQFSAEGNTYVFGTSLLSHSGMTFTNLENNGWIVPEANSELQIGNLTGTGDITDIDATTIITGTAQTSETIGLLDSSQLWLAQPSFLAPIDMDSTSEVHIYTPASIAEVVSTLTSLGGPNNALPFKGLFDIHSLTPGYQPEAEFQFAGPAVVGVTIVDKPIIMPGQS